MHLNTNDFYLPCNFDMHIDADLALLMEAWE